MGYGRNAKVAKVGGMEIEVLGAEASKMYLGRLLSLTDPHGTELRHRTRRAWAKFAIFKEELVDKDVPLRLRLKLFHTVVSPTMLYGCSSWVLTKAKMDNVNATQMKMTRTILGSKRTIDQQSGETETWVEWVRRTTSKAREQLHANRIPQWTQMVKTRQDRWSSRLEELDTSRWAKQVLHWKAIGYRSPGRPVKRWEDERSAG